MHCDDLSCDYYVRMRTKLNKKYKAHLSILLFFLLLTFLGLAFQVASAATPPLNDHTTITEQDILALFPSATLIKPALTSPPVWPVYQLQELIGFAFESRNLTNFPGFSGDPLNLLIGIDTKGVFSGVKLISHHEPIFLHGLGPEPLINYLNQYSGMHLTDRIVLIKQGTSNHNADSGTVYFDAVTKATVSIIVVNDTVLSSALKVARQTLDDFAQQTPAVVNHEIFNVMSWQDLLSQGLVKKWVISREEIEQQLGNSLDDYPETQWSDSNDDENITLYFAYLNAPTVGKNLLGESEFNRLQDKLAKDESAVLLMSQGFYDAIGDDFKPGTIPERFNLIQHGLPVPIRDINFYNYSQPQLATGAADFNNRRVFKIRAQSGFDPSAAMDLQLLINLKKNHLIEEQVKLTSSYHLAENYFIKNAPVIESTPQPIWVRIWQNRLLEIIVLITSLLLLSIIFLRQQSIMKSIRRFYLIRWSFLFFTLIFIGFYSQGQLSVVNIFTLFNEVREGFDISLFLLDPIIFILWIFTVVSLLLWGRGVFCGWLCPFGALQEMLAWVASRLKIRQWKLKHRTHRALLKLKYFFLIILLLISFFSLNTSMILSELEPFKTAITLYFIRSWPFVLYAVLLLGLGLYINKFYCRYICPLGAGLAILGKIHLLEKLRRRPECGAKCQMCRNRCPVDAIHKNGKINYSECIQCLECLAIINDPSQCAIDLQSFKGNLKQSDKTIPISVVTGNSGIGS